MFRVMVEDGLGAVAERPPWSINDMKEMLSVTGESG